MKNRRMRLLLMMFLALGASTVAAQPYIIEQFFNWEALLVVPGW